MTEAAPTWARIFATCSSMMPAFVQSASSPATSKRNARSAAWPRGVWRTSGCHCVPHMRRSRSSNAATGEPSVVASTAKPGGASWTASPWDIHTDCSPGLPARKDARLGDRRRRSPKLAQAGLRYRSAEGAGHELKPVTDAHDGEPRLEESRVDVGRALLVHGGRAPAQDDGRGISGEHVGRAHRVRNDLGVDVRLSHAARDQLGILRPEVDDEDGAVAHGAVAHGAVAHGAVTHAATAAANSRVIRRSTTKERPGITPPRMRTPSLPQPHLALVQRSAHVTRYAM